MQRKVRTIIVDFTKIRPSLKKEIVHCAPNVFENHVMVRGECQFLKSDGLLKINECHYLACFLSRSKQSYYYKSKANGKNESHIFTLFDTILFLFFKKCPTEKCWSQFKLPAVVSVIGPG